MSYWLHGMHPYQSLPDRNEADIFGKTIFRKTEINPWAKRESQKTRGRNERNHFDILDTNGERPVRQ